jgi:hypothetical protein
MLRGVFKDLLIIFGGTLFFLVLCATLGISLSTRDATPTFAAEEHDFDTEGRNIEQPSIWILYPLGSDEQPTNDQTSPQLMNFASNYSGR